MNVRRDEPPLARFHMGEPPATCWERSRWYSHFLQFSKNPARVGQLVAADWCLRPGVRR